jgi:hypothetical protein
VKHHPSLKHWVPDQLRPGPTLKDIGGHIIKHEWGDQTNKRENTIKFVKTIDEEWNSFYGVEQSTKEIFKW